MYEGKILEAFRPLEGNFSNKYVDVYSSVLRNMGIFQSMNHALAVDYANFEKNCFLLCFAIQPKLYTAMSDMAVHEPEYLANSFDLGIELEEGSSEPLKIIVSIYRHSQVEILPITNQVLVKDL